MKDNLIEALQSTDDMNSYLNTTSTLQIIEDANEWIAAAQADLRDVFAGQALTGLLTDTAWIGTHAKNAAHEAYIFADAMIEARESQP